MNQTVEPLTFTVPLSFAAHAAAQAATQQMQSRQLYLKALAVYAVEFYLRCLGIPASSEGCDWRDPWMAKFIEVADLQIEAYGRLECCVLLPAADHLSISSDAWADRIGYMAVQFDPALTAATLLGFTLQPAADLPLNQLQPLDRFPAYLQSLAPGPQAAPVTQIAPSTQIAPVTQIAPSTQIAPVTQIAPKSPVPKLPVRLRGWLEGVVETGWQQLEDLLGQAQLPLAVRSQNQFEISVRQAKLIDVGMALGEQTVVLSLAITPNPDTSMTILTQVYPVPPDRHLPPQLRLTMLSEAGELLQAVCSREQDSYIQLRHFQGEAGDSFEIQVRLDQVCVSESFIL